MYSLTLLGVRSWKSSCGNRHAPFLEENLFHHFLLASCVAGKPWNSLACRSITLVFAPLSHAYPVPVYPFSSSKDTSCIWLKSYPTLAWPHRKMIISQRPYFQMKSNSRVTKFINGTCILEGSNQLTQRIKIRYQNLNKNWKEEGKKWMTLNYDIHDINLRL